MKREDNVKMRNNILDSVIACKVEAEGAEVSLFQICSKAGISERTLSRYFPDKEMMIYAAAEKYLTGLYDDFAQQFLSTVTPSMNGLEKLNYLVRLQIETYRNDTTKAKVFVRAFTTTMYTAVYRNLPPPQHDAATRDLVISCVEEGIRDGSVRKDVVPLDTYFVVSSCFVGLVQRLVYIYSVNMPRDKHKETILLVLDKFANMLIDCLGKLDSQ